MNRFDLLLYAVGTLVAVSSLVRLMLARRIASSPASENRIATRKKATEDFWLTTSNHQS